MVLGDGRIDVLGHLFAIYNGVDNSLEHVELESATLLELLAGDVVKFGRVREEA